MNWCIFDLDKMLKDIKVVCDYIIKKISSLPRPKTNLLRAFFLLIKQNLNLLFMIKISYDLFCWDRTSKSMESKYLLTKH